MAVDSRVLLDSSELFAQTRLQDCFKSANLTFAHTRPMHEKITKEEVEAVIESYKRMNWWP